MAESLSLEGLRRRFSHLPQGLLDHLKRVSQLAGQLAARWDVDPERAALVGFLHDVARAEDPAWLLARARELGLVVHPVEEAVPVLLHGPLAAALVEQELGLKDQEMLAAITWHSTGRGGVSRFLLGSVTERVVRYSNDPVLVLRDFDSAHGPEVLEGPQ